MKRGLSLCLDDPFALIFSALNGFCWVNSFSFVRPTIPQVALYPITVTAPQLFENTFYVTQPIGRQASKEILLLCSSFIYGGQIVT